MKICFSAILILLIFTAPAFATVSVSKPWNGETVGSPVQFVASGTTSSCSSGVAAMGVYVDDVLKYTVHQSNLNTALAISAGAHHTVVQEWDYCGTSTYTAVNITVASTAGVVVTLPANGSTVSSPVQFVASGTTSSCSSGVAAMGVYVDDVLKYTVHQSNLNTALAISAGAHHTVVQEWDYCGTSSYTPVNVTVSASSTSTASSSISISSPSNGESVSSPFTLTAYATACSYQPISSMGYSFDYGDTTILTGSTSIDTKVSASLGTHTLHVKSWGDNGAVCVADVAVTVSSVTNDAATNTSIVPSDAVSVSSLQTFSNWQAIHDSGSGGWASGYMSLVGSPVHSGSSREFVTHYSNSGGERYHMTFGDDTTSTNFMYDGWVYLTSSATQIANLEMDLNQTMPNGQTVIFGFQCDGYSGTWDYTENMGTPTSPKVHWAHSSAACNPRSWSRYAWHHVQINYSRNDYGTVTYKYVWLDGVQKNIWATVPSAYALGWGPTLLTNFQVDGLGSSGSSTVYLDDLIVYRW